MSAEGAKVLFHVAGLGVTSPITTQWLIIGFITLLSYLGTRKLSRVPKGIQNVLEFVVEGLLNFYSGLLGREKAKRFLPFLVTMFLFIILSNYSGLLPGFGHIPGLQAPTSVLSVTAGLALIVFFTTQYLGVREKGLSYFKHFFQPFFFFLPINIIEELVKPLSLALRLYGNIYGEEMIITVLLSLAPYFGPLPMMGLSLLMGFMQALVFTLLTAVYIGTATSHDH